MCRFNIALFTLFFILSNTVAQAQFQPAPVEKSNQKVLFNGKVYYIHTVKQNQTLSSISRAYGITIQDIAVANPNVVLEVISVGQALKIPTISELDDFSESYYGLSSDDFVYHTVQTQQTIFYISKKYNVSEKEIYYYNPGSEEVIQIGQVLKIPKPNTIQHSPNNIATADSNAYIVKQGDTLYSLSKKYGLSVADLIRANPQLRWGLKEGMALNISNTTNNIDFIPLYDSLQTPIYSKITLFPEKKCDSIARRNKNEAIKIALLLPLHAKELLSLDSISNDSLRRAHPYNKYRSRGHSFAEFYEGFLLALDSLKTTKQQITLFTFDTKSDTIAIDKIIKELDIIRPDIIYGPIIPANIQRISAYSAENKIPMVLPLTKSMEKYTSHNPYAISVMPSSKAELNGSADFVSQYHDKNIILIHNKDSINKRDVINFRETLLAYFSSKAAYEEALYKEIRMNDSLKQNLSHALRSNTENIVIVYSENEAYVSNIIGMLRIKQSAGYTINLLGLPEWQSFENLRIELLHSLNTVIYSPFYIDYTKRHTQLFVRNCREKLNYEPYRTVNTGSGFNFAYLGYETGLMFTEAYKSYGDDFLNCLCHLQFKMPQSDYRFEQNMTSGFSNVNINLVNFTPEFEVKAIDYESLKEINKKTKDAEIDISSFMK